MTTEVELAPMPTILAALPDGDEVEMENYDEAFQLLPDEYPDISHIVTEDDTPVDNLPSAKNQRLLVEPLYSSWTPPAEMTTFLADANVGIFYMVKRPPLVPDVFVSLDVQVPDNWWEKQHRSYFVWEFGKSPDVVIEIVSNQKGGEDGRKFRLYEWIGVDYYIIYDPMEHLDRGVLRVYGLQNGTYVPLYNAWMPKIGLGVTLWQGEYEGKEDTWLRWCDKNGKVILTGKECAEYERQEKERERQEKEQLLLHTERLAMKLRELGVDPSTL